MKTKGTQFNLKPMFLQDVFRYSWSKETCHPALQGDWSRKNPAYGQCLVTALIVQESYGGKLVYCKHYDHYWNRFKDGMEVDFTKMQFTKQEKLCADMIKSKNSVLKVKHVANRFRLLKKRVILNTLELWISGASFDNTVDMI